MSILKKIVFLFLYLSGMPLLIRELIQKNKVTIIYYHNPKKEIFEKHILALSRRYNIISLRHYIDAKKNNVVNSLPEKSLIITIDDGNCQNYCLLPIIKNNNIPVTIFLTSGIINTTRQFWFRSGISSIEREQMKKISDDHRLSLLLKKGFEETKKYQKRHALSKNEIEEMKPFVDFQSHTIFHPILPLCSDLRSYQEISKSKSDLEKDYNLNIYAISYPNGDYSEREISFAVDAKYDCGLTTNAGYNTQSTNIFQLNRISITDNAGIIELIVRASSLWGRLKCTAKKDLKNE